MPASWILASALAAPAASNSPPVITIELPPNPGWFTANHWGDLERIKITVTDPDGDRVTADLVAAPTWEGFRPITNEPSGATRELRWRTFRAGGGFHDLVVRAHDAVDPSTVVVAKQRLLLLGVSVSQRAIAHDFDRDGRDELLTSASYADVGGAVDSGTLALFDRFGTGGFGPAPTLLHAAIPGAGDRLGDADSGDLLIADVTGDGRDDVIASDRHGALVWSAPIPGSAARTPIAVLRGSDPAAGFTSHGQNLLVHDLTGDGILDLVAIASSADLGGVNGVGEICIFAGGASLQGAPAPWARLQVPGAVAHDLLGDVGTAFLPAQGAVIADVTGDGRADVVALASWADRGAVKNSGKGYVWDGASLAGTPAPRAILDAAAAKADDVIGLGRGPLIVDLTGDGVQDVLIDGNNVGSSGSWFLWHGGSGLTGTLDATARLRTSSAQAQTSVFTIRLRDFVRDGVTDLIGCNSYEDIAGVKDAGVVQFWRGGSHLTGLVFESATFRRASPGVGDALGAVIGGLQVVDVTGDAIEDLVVASPLAAGVATKSGVITVFAGGGVVSGTTLPSAELQVPAAAADDRMGDARSYSAE